MDFNQIFREKTKNFSITVIRNLSSLAFSDDIYITRKQIIRSATSAVSRARSEKEKFVFVVEEIDETQLCLKSLKN
ncbi:hypothetical protein [Chryseobacterium sp. Tr-659]|uniref:hypothetical protein n=1 Tax=Chryseobacterium sp. Tr-659 TaxID=2608340 RepID=UPI001E4BB77B|nr:hypothetical protein [Chryseobacterium sp. Tr-659]